MERTDASVVARGRVHELAGAALTREDRASVFRYMAMMRASEERALTLYKQGKVPGSFYDGRGQEAISVGAAFALRPEDRTCILHRDLGAHLVRGVTPDRYLANYMGRAGGVTGGRDGNMHFGDGSTANGQWHEAMNLAGIHRLPVVFVLENNRFAYSTPNELEFAVDPIERAHTYGFPGVNVDGNDVEAVFEAARAAADLARAGGGPTLIECQTMRMHGHGAHDDMRYVPKELHEEWERRDPIGRYAQRLVADHGFSTDEVEGIR